MRINAGTALHYKRDPVTRQEATLIVSLPGVHAYPQSLTTSPERLCRDYIDIDRQTREHIEYETCAE